MYQAIIRGALVVVLCVIYLRVMGVSLVVFYYKTYILSLKDKIIIVRFTVIHDIYISQTQYC